MKIRTTTALCKYEQRKKVDIGRDATTRLGSVMLQPLGRMFFVVLFCLLGLLACQTQPPAEAQTRAVTAASTACDPSNPPILIKAWGQSNNEDCCAIWVGPWNGDPRVTYFKWGAWTPFGPDDGGTFGPDLFLAPAIADATGRPIVYSKEAFRGTSIESWEQDGGANWPKEFAGTQATLEYANEPGAEIHITTLQGEENGSDTRDQYYALLDTFAASVNALYPGLTPYWHIGLVNVNDGVQFVGVRQAQYDWAHTAGHNADLEVFDDVRPALGGVHYDHDQLRDIVAPRFANAILRNGGTLGPDSGLGAHDAGAGDAAADSGAVARPWLIALTGQFNALGQAIWPNPPQPQYGAPSGSIYKRTYNQGAPTLYPLGPLPAGGTGTGSKYYGSELELGTKAQNVVIEKTGTAGGCTCALPTSFGCVSSSNYYTSGVVAETQDLDTQAPKDVTLNEVFWIGEKDAQLSTTTASSIASCMASFAAQVRSLVPGRRVHLIIPRLNAVEPSNYTNTQAVRDGQAAFVAADSDAVLIDLDPLGTPPSGYYTGFGQYNAAADLIFAQSVGP